MGQAAIAVALGAAGELQRGRRDAGLPLRGGILPESPSGERECTFIRFEARDGTQRVSGILSKIAPVCEVLCLSFHSLFLIYPLRFDASRLLPLAPFHFYDFWFISRSRVFRSIVL